MTSYKELSDAAKTLAKLLKPGARNTIPDDVKDRIYSGLAGFIDTLGIYLPPTPEQKKKAKAHPTAAQILKFVTLNAERKRFFDAGYFQAIFKALPSDKKLITLNVPGTLATARDAVILYHYRAEKSGTSHSLSRLQTQIETDYNSRPEARELRKRTELYREMLTMSSPEKITARLAQEFPDEIDLAKFAKSLKLKVPAQSRKKGAVKKSAHARLAEAIHKKGSIARLELE